MKQTILFLMILLTGCSFLQKPTEKDAVGTFVSAEGAILELREDHTFTITGITGENSISGIYPFGYKQDVFNGKGIWELGNDYHGRKIIDISIETAEGKSATQLNFRGQGILELQPPWDIFFYIGDPDSMNRYIFRRKQ